MIPGTSRGIQLAALTAATICQLGLLAKPAASQTPPSAMPLVSVTVRTPEPRPLYLVTSSNTDSYPFVVEFELTTDGETADTSRRATPLYDVRYSVHFTQTTFPPPLDVLIPGGFGPTGPFDDIRIIRPECADATYSDSISLYGRRAPGVLIAYPGIQIPPDTREMRVCVRVTYADEFADGGFATATALKTFAVNPPEGGGVFARMRQGILRRHISEEGRLLSWTWLKEYNPTRDPIELVHHSRTMFIPGVATGSPAKLYIPWLNSVKDGAPTHLDGAIFYGEENPLLRGGLAMAAFSLEYLKYESGDSYLAALKLFRYMQDSEWKVRGQGTGFFLRKRWPGDEKAAEVQHFHASVDEITGMVLGLVYFHKAAKRMGHPRQTIDEIEALCHRLGTHLHNNFFLLLPPPGLPQVRQKGWSGTYMWEYFLDRGLHLCTGNTYTRGTNGPQDSWWSKVKAMPLVGTDADDDKDYMDILLELGVEPFRRALYGISGVGFGMYWGGRAYPLKFSVIPEDSLLDWLSGGAASEVTQITHYIDIPPFDQFNLPMLQHAYLIAKASSDWGSPMEETILDAAIGSLFDAVLIGRSYEVDIPSKYLAFKFLTANPAWLLVAPLLVLPGMHLIPEDYTIRIGEHYARPDFYGAAIVKRYGISTYRARGVFDELVPSLSTHWWTSGLPLSDKKTPPVPPAAKVWDPTDNPNGTLVKDHNPLNRYGSAFVFERTPPPPVENWMDRGGGSKRDGVADSMLKDQWSKFGSDLAREAVGLDLYFSLLLAVDELPESWRADIESAVKDKQSHVRVPGCVTNPTGPTKCVWPFITRAPDKFEPNDSIAEAQKLPCGTTRLTIDRSTRQSRYRNQWVSIYEQQPIMGRPGAYSDHWKTDDVDYFRATCDKDRKLRVTVVFEDGEFHKWVVNGAEAPTPTVVTGTRKSATVTVDARSEHIIMVTGDATRYAIQTQAVNR